MWRRQSRYPTGASAIGVPGCPDSAACTASIDRTRMELITSQAALVSIGVVVVTGLGRLLVTVRPEWGGR